MDVKAVSKLCKMGIIVTLSCLTILLIFIYQETLTTFVLVPRVVISHNDVTHRTKDVTPRDAIPRDIDATSSNIGVITSNNGVNPRENVPLAPDIDVISSYNDITTRNNDVIPGQNDVKHEKLVTETMTNETKDSLTTSTEKDLNKNNATEEENTGHYIKHHFQGRLGNVLFQYASINCIAKMRKLSLLLEANPALDWLKNPPVQTERDIFLNIRSGRHKWERLCCTYDPSYETLTNDKNYLFQGYYQSWRYFEPCKNDVPEWVSFNETFVNEAKIAVKKLREIFPKKVLIGIHIRMEDHTAVRAVLSGKRIATPEYYHKAMNYFKTRFHDVRFIIITKSSEWFLSHVGDEDVTFLNRTTPATDMEILSRLDHLIITVGTFGWWAAYKSQGIVVCFNDFYAPRSLYAEQYEKNSTDYLLPGWVRL